MYELTPSQEDYFKTLESLNPSADTLKAIRAARQDLQRQNSGDRVIRGESRVRGFTVETPKK